jgi:hypothetical protein
MYLAEQTVGNSSALAYVILGKSCRLGTGTIGLSGTKRLLII